MKQITIHSLSDKGYKALQEHYKTTPLRYKIVMRVNGVTQKLTEQDLIILWDNQRIRDLQLYFPDDLDKYFNEKVGDLKKDINKMGVVEGTDYSVEVL